MPRKAAPYGGLSPVNARLIRQYLKRLQDHDYHLSPAALARLPTIRPDAATHHGGFAAFSVWTWLVVEAEADARATAAECGITPRTVDALRAGLSVLKRKRVARVGHFNAHHSFGAIGITAPSNKPAASAETNGSPTGLLFGNA